MTSTGMEGQNSSGRMFALALAELLIDGGRQNIMNLRPGINFTVVTPVHSIGLFQEVQKTLSQCRYVIRCWMLDGRSASAAQIKEAWQAMSQTSRSGLVDNLGMRGVTRPAYDAVMAIPGGEPISTWSMDLYAG